jgi:hypothetical protein
MRHMLEHYFERLRLSAYPFRSKRRFGVAHVIKLVSNMRYI